MLKLEFGLTIFASILLPSNYFKIFVGGDPYRSFVNQFSPIVFSFINLAVTLLVAFILATIIIRKLNLVNRIPTVAPGINLLAICGVIILLSQIISIIIAPIPIRGAAFTLIASGYFMVVITKLLMYVGIVRLLLAVKPHESYVYK